MGSRSGSAEEPPWYTLTNGQVELNARAMSGGRTDRAGPRRRPDGDTMRRRSLIVITAAMTVLWITYLSFVFAFVLPYVQSQGFLETVRPSFCGGICLAEGGELMVRWCDCR